MSDQYICSRCFTELLDYSAVAYDGPAHNGIPAPEDERCDLFMEWVTLCQSCYVALTNNAPNGFADEVRA
ncbi:MAG: hypothetical protein ACLFS2_06595 [Halochromatium sp.]